MHTFVWEFLYQYIIYVHINMVSLLRKDEASSFCFGTIALFFILFMLFDVMSRLAVVASFFMYMQKSLKVSSVCLTAFCLSGGRENTSNTGL